MSNKNTFSPLWRTASFSDSPDSHQMDLLILQRHLDLCTKVVGRMQGVRHGVFSMSRFCSARIVTASLLLALLLVAVSAAI
jgi:hypothetical protein